MASTIQDMIQKAKKDVGANNPSTPVEESTENQGIEIERQNIDHVRGSAKSGKF